MAKKAVGIFPSKVIVGFVVCAVVLLVIAVVPYWIRFGMDLSSDKNDWAVFGTYLGGVLGPAYTLLAFAAFLFTIHQQRRQAMLEELQDVMDDALDEIAKRRAAFEASKVKLSTAPNAAIRAIRFREMLISD